GSDAGGALAAEAHVAAREGRLGPVGETILDVVARARGSGGGAGRQVRVATGGRARGLARFGREAVLADAGVAEAGVERVAVAVREAVCLAATGYDVAPRVRRACARVHRAGPARHGAVGDVAGARARAVGRSVAVAVRARRGAISHRRVPITAARDDVGAAARREAAPVIEVRLGHVDADAVAQRLVRHV